MTSAATVPSGQLRDMIESVALACGKDNTLPTLTSIFFEMDPKDGTLILTTTDRYKLINATVPAVLSFNLSDESIKSFLLQKTDAMALVKMLPKGTKTLPASTPVRIEFGEKKALFYWDGGMSTFETYEAKFPDWRSLVEKRKEHPKAAAQISFNVNYLAVLDKIKANTTWDFAFSGDGKPVFVYSCPDMASDPKYLVMIMPVRKVK